MRGRSAFRSRILFSEDHGNSLEANGKLACKMPDDQEAVSPVATPANADVPQFYTAEYAHIPGSELCRVCGNLISSIPHSPSSPTCTWDSSLWVWAGWWARP
jgi:hypothetical protein